MHHHHHDCQHDKIDRRPPTIVPQQRQRRRRLNRDSSPPPPLRVVFWPLLEVDGRTCYAEGDHVDVGEVAFNCTADNVLTPEKQVALTRLLDAAAAWLSAAFAAVEPVVGALSVANTPCGFGGDVSIPPDILANGAPATDVLTFVTARPIIGTALAFAGHCQEDQGSSAYVPRRPSVGHINVSPASLERLVLANRESAAAGSGAAGASATSVDAASADAAAADAAAIADLLGVMLHEAFHVLGFSQSKLRELPCPAALDYDRHDAATYEPRPCAAAGSSEPVVPSTHGPADGRAHLLLVTPRVRQMARVHYGCEHLEGVPLEACRGGSDCLTGTGTASSHWEKRVLLGEVLLSDIDCF